MGGDGLMSRTTFLNGRSYARLRGALAQSLSTTGYQLAGAGTVDQSGGEIQTWGTAGTFACRIDPLAGGERVFGERMSDRSTHIVTLPPNSTVDHNDRFQIDGDTYEITAVRSATAERARRLEVVEIS